MTEYRNYTIHRHGTGRCYLGYFQSQAAAEKFIDDYSDGKTSTSKHDWIYA
jgi:hypothetical protein